MESAFHFDNVTNEVNCASPFKLYVDNIYMDIWCKLVNLVKREVICCGA